MKKLAIYLLALFLSIGYGIEAQVSVNVNIGTPPPWAPPGHVKKIRYYYLPDIEMYYDIHTANFIYWHSGSWIFAPVLPHWHSHFDLYGAHKVVINDYFGPKPFLYYKTHKVKYPKGYKGPPPGHMKKIAGKPGKSNKGPHHVSGGNGKFHKWNGNGHGKGHGGGKGKR